MRIEAAWMRPDVVEPYARDMHRRWRAGPWGELEAFVDYLEEGELSAEVVSRRRIEALVGQTVGHTSRGGRAAAVDRLLSLGLVSKEGHDRYRIHPGRTYWLRFFSLELCKAEWLGLRRDLDEHEVARHTAHLLARREGVSDGLPPKPNRNLTFLEDLSGMEGLARAIGMYRSVAVRTAYELVQWIQASWAMDMGAPGQALIPWSREQVRQHFQSQGFRTSNSSLKQVTTLGTALGLLAPHYHGRLPIGWKPQPDAFPLADMFLNHLVDHPEVKTERACLAAASEFLQTLERKFGPRMSWDQSPGWQDLRRRWQIEMASSID